MAKLCRASLIAFGSLENSTPSFVLPVCDARDNA
jgi:hypothetical protein